MNANIIEYKPSYIKLPPQLKKDFKKWPDQLSQKQQNPDYDNFSLFYDVFFDLKKENIWAIGPPLFSLEENFLNVKIFHQEEELIYKYHKYIKDKDYNYFCGINYCLQIPLDSKKKEIRELKFVGKNWSINVPVSNFPKSKNTTQPTMSVIQKDYSIQHIIDWILWHYRLYDFRKFLFYDNGSKNIEKILEKFYSLDIPIEIIFIHWPFYWGHKTPPFTDAFAQYTQLNHTNILYYKYSCLITNWDIDEYLVCSNKKYFQKIKKQSYYKFFRYNGFGAKNASSIRDFSSISAIPEQMGKYFYSNNNLFWLNCPHFRKKPLLQKFKKNNIYIYQYIYKIIIYKIIFYFNKKIILFLKPKIYIMHANFLKLYWSKLQKINEKRNSSKLVKNKTVIACLKKAKFISN